MEENERKDHIKRIAMGEQDLVEGGPVVKTKISKLPIGTKIWVGPGLGACRGGWAVFDGVSFEHTMLNTDIDWLANYLKWHCDEDWPPDYIRVAEQLFADGSLEWPL